MVFIDKELELSKYKIKDVANKLTSVIKITNYTEEEEIVENVVSRLEDPFMFVVVGEVKAGKSSFVNALLDPGKEICKVAAHPMTDTIQQIMYGEEEREENISKYLKKIYLDNDILKEVIIVDTPGTNTIVEHHQEITERFVPVSDLIIFVFEAKNPYRESSWKFFDYIKAEWRKKVIFVLQQKDLLNEDDLATNLKGVVEYAKKQDMPEPLVFSVSAKMEIENNTEQSGYVQLRQYIKDQITTSKTPILKLDASVDTLINVNNKILDGMSIRIKQYEEDFKFRGEIKDILQSQEEKTNKNTAVLVENLLAKYDKISVKYQDRLSERLGFFNIISKSVVSIWDKNENLNRWLGNFTDQLEQELKDSMGKSLNDGIKNIADSIQTMAKLVDAKLHSSKSILNENHNIFNDLAERRANILKDLLDAFSKFINKEENFYDRKLMNQYSNISPELLKGSGMAAIGVILSALTNGIIFDITGGILTTLGLVFAGVGIGLKRKKILKGFKEELQKGREKLQENITDKMTNYVSDIKNKIDSNFLEFDEYMRTEKRDIDDIKNRQTEIAHQFDDIKKELNKKLNSI